ncbi:MutS-related protein [Niabella hirudinis]|uniref:MutS-related protein n=1 Tax=Niabella hirudinis TaxID=1285929 RepID=UPI003EB6D9D0
MTNNHQITDLNILKEILPVFNYTNNPFAEQVLAELLTRPLPSIALIEERQQILKGFVKNYPCLKSYNYSRAAFTEVYQFIQARDQPFTGNGIFTSKAQKGERQALMNAYAQFVLFFDELLRKWITMISLSFFPGTYKATLETLQQQLTDLDLPYYAGLLSEQQFGQKAVKQLSAKIVAGKQDGSWQRFWPAFFLFEAYTSVSLAIVRKSFAFPAFGNGPITIRDLYHPLLSDPVKNDMVLSKNVGLLTGPNMAGKSTLLKAIGLCVFLAHTGIAVSASAAKIPFFDHIAIFINHRDDLQNGYSHFMYEIKNLKNLILEAARGKRCFSVFDELFKGTNSADALAITASTLEGMHRFENSCFLVSTHLHELKTQPVITSNIVQVLHIDCIIENGRPRFTYKLEDGWSDLKIGRLLFEAEGLYELLR